MDITDYQHELMKHTIGEVNRNWFATNYGGKDSEAFEQIVEAGYATKEKVASWMDDDVIYRLIEEGRKVL